MLKFHFACFPRLKAVLFTYPLLLAIRITIMNNFHLEEFENKTGDC